MGAKVGASAGRDEASQPLLSTVILTWNTLHWSRQAFRRVVEETEGIEREIIWIDQGSTDGTQDYVRALPFSVRRNLYVSGDGLPRATSIGRNLGIEDADGRYLMLLDGDIIPPKGWIRLATDWLRKHPDFWGITIFPGLWTHNPDEATEQLTELKDVRVSASSMTNLGIIKREYFDGNLFPAHALFGEWGWGYEDTWQSANSRRLGRIPTACVFDPSLRYLHPCNSSCGLLDRFAGEEERKRRVVARKALLDAEFAERPVG